MKMEVAWSPKTSVSYVTVWHHNPDHGLNPHHCVGLCWVGLYWVILCYFALCSVLLGQLELLFRGMVCFSVPCCEISPCNFITAWASNWSYLTLPPFFQSSHAMNYFSFNLQTVDYLHWFVLIVFSQVFHQIWNFSVYSGQFFWNSWSLFELLLNVCWMLFNTTTCPAPWLPDVVITHHNVFKKFSHLPEQEFWHAVCSQFF